MSVDDSTTPGTTAGGGGNALAGGRHGRPGGIAVVAKWIAGVDIGGTTLSVGMVPAAGGRPRALRTGDTPGGRGGEAVVDRVCGMIRAAVDELARAEGPGAEVSGVGIAAPGSLDRARGIVLESHNLGWFGLPLRDRVQAATGLPTVVENDANCAACGEWWQGAGRGFRSVLGITLGTGIGGGIVMDGRPFVGATGAAGEIGHMTVKYGGRRCTCGARGCLEAYASGPGIARTAVEGLAGGARSTLPELVAGDLDRITAATVHQAAVGGDAYATGVLARAARMLAAGIASAVNLLAPDAVVVMGGVAEAGDLLFGPLAAELARPRFRSAVDACTVVPGALPGTAGVVGAAGVFRLRAEET